MALLRSATRISYLGRGLDALLEKKVSFLWSKRLLNTSSTTFNVARARGNQDYSEPIELHRALREPTAKLEEKLRLKGVQGMFSELNRVKDTQKLLSIFKKRLHYESIKVQDESGSSSKTSNLSLVDFINPRMENFGKALSLIETDNYPSYLLKFYGLESKEDLLELMLTKLLLKEHTKLSITETEYVDTSIDISSPERWFPEARKMKRKVIMHVGPTNSGKTYNSLQKLKQSRSGYYAGPLRLLAREIYEKFQEEGVKCNLITGEEVVPSIDEFGKISEISSGTIEMVPLHKKMDLCIIDEIQMIADERRGAAWTSALLGIQAKEIHLCGEESAVPLIEKIVKTTGDELEINKYKRLGKLTVLQSPLKTFKNLEKGDCVIAFSKRKILELKCEIEKVTKFKVGVIYGALPPEIRSKEADGFNYGNYDILVASDAVGMGLNLKIKRIVFHTVKKYNGSETVPLTPSITKQIAGRAGRYSKDVGESEGFVTALTARDLVFVKKMMKSPIRKLTKACIWPTNEIWTQYIVKFPKYTPFHDILQKFELDTSDVKMEDYFITELDVRYEILKLFLEYNLYRKVTIEDQLSLSLVPINIRMASPLVIDTAHKFFQNIANSESRNVFHFNFLHENILKQRPKYNSTVEESVQLLQSLEEDHKLVLIFLWLSQRWPTLFVDKESAMDIKTLIEKRISEELQNLRSLTKSSSRSFSKRRTKRK